MNKPGPTQIAAPALVFSLALALWLALRLPYPLRPAIAPPTAPVTYAPTVAPPTTDLSQPTDTAAVPAGLYATQQAGDLATSLARATAQPFATAGPPLLQAGAPASLTVARGGLSLQVRLPKTTLFAGEAALAEITLSNRGPETVVVTGSWPPFELGLLDAQGQAPPAWPWSPVPIMGGPPFIQALAPGQSLTSTQVVQVGGPAARYALWARVRFSRARPGQPDNPDDISLRLEAGPLPIDVQPAPVERQLRAQLQADRNGWTLRVTDALGQVPPGPYAGEFEAGSANGLTAGPLNVADHGVWSGLWDGLDFNGVQLDARAWVGAPGYVSALATVHLDGPGDPVRWFDVFPVPTFQSFATFASARAALGLPLYRLGALPPGAAFDSLRATVDDFNPPARFVDVHQLYRLADGGWLDLHQSQAPLNAYGLGDASDDAERLTLSLAGQPAYLAQYWGWWTLDWQIGAQVFELRAPAADFSPAQLLALAASAAP